MITHRGMGSDWKRSAPRGSFYVSLQYTDANDYAQALGFLYACAHLALSEGREGRVIWEHRPLQIGAYTGHYASVTIVVDPIATFEHGREHRKLQRTAWQAVSAFLDHRFSMRETS